LLYYVNLLAWKQKFTKNCSKWTSAENVVLAIPKMFRQNHQTFINHNNNIKIIKNAK